MRNALGGFAFEDNDAVKSAELEEDIPTQQYTGYSVAVGVIMKDHEREFPHAQL